LNLNFIYSLQASKAQAGIGEGKGFVKVLARAYVEGAIPAFAWCEITTRR